MYVGSQAYVCVKNMGAHVYGGTCVAEGVLPEINLEFYFQVPFTLFIC